MSKLNVRKPRQPLMLASAKIQVSLMKAKCNKGSLIVAVPEKDITENLASIVCLRTGATFTHTDGVYNFYK